MRMRGFSFLLFGFACPGCYAGIGPTLGTAGRSPTLGWELSAATVTVGQSFATDSEPTLVRAAKPHRDSFTRRTYLLWEPSFGPAPYEEDGALTFGGAGVSVGMGWDRIAGATGAARTQFGALGGAFLGAGHAFASGARTCDITFQPYISLAVGFRGNEVYVTPKGGVAGVPQLCLKSTGLFR